MYLRDKKASETVRAGVLEALGLLVEASPQVWRTYYPSRHKTGTYSCTQMHAFCTLASSVKSLTISKPNQPTRQKSLILLGVTSAVPPIREGPESSYSATAGAGPWASCVGLPRWIGLLGAAWCVPRH